MALLLFSEEVTFFWAWVNSVRTEDAVVAVLKRIASDPAAPEDERRIAAETCMLLVYEDIGGALLVDKQGEVFILQETIPVRAEENTMEHRLGRVAASEKHPELSGFRPKRGSDATTCDACVGIGELVGVRCRRCLGLGWV